MTPRQITIYDWSTMPVIIMIRSTVRPSDELSGITYRHGLPITWARMAGGNIGSIGMRNFYKCHALFETISSLSGD